MRIAFFFREPLREPINLREYYLCRELQQRGHKILWIMLFKKGDSSADLKIDDVRFDIIHIDPDRINTYRQFSRAIKRTLQDNNIQIAWISGWFERSPRYLFQLFRGLRSAKCKIAYDPIDPIFEYTVSTQIPPPGLMHKRFLRFQMRLCYRQCDLVFAVTPLLKNALTGYGLPVERIQTAPWGTDISRFDSDKVPDPNPFREARLLEGKFVIGWLGTMSRFKGLEEILIPVIEDLVSLHDRIAFRIAGSGPLYEELENRFKTMPSGYVKLIKDMPYDDAPAFTSSLDCYLVPTNPYNMIGNCIVPVKIFDALSVGVPVIATRSDAVSAIADCLKGIILVEWGKEHFSEAIREAMKNHAANKRCAVLGVSASKQFSHQYISKKIANRLESLST